MNNSNNLVSLSSRTTEEQREIARAGGIASGEARRERKRLKEAIEAALQLPYTDMMTGKTMSNLEAIVAALIEQARQGNVSAFKELRNTIDGLPTATVAMEPPISPETYARVEAILGGDCE